MLIIIISSCKMVIKRKNPRKSVLISVFKSNGDIGVSYFINNYRVPSIERALLNDG